MGIALLAAAAVIAWSRRRWVRERQGWQEQGTKSAVDILLPDARFGALPGADHGVRQGRPAADAAAHARGRASRAGEGTVANPTCRAVVDET